MTHTHPAPPFDVELGAVLAALGEMLPPTLTPEMIAPMRQGGLLATPIDELIGDRPIRHEERRVPGPAGAPESRCRSSRAPTTSRRARASSTPTAAG